MSTMNAWKNAKPLQQQNTSKQQSKAKKSEKPVAVTKSVDYSSSEDEGEYDEKVLLKSLYQHYQASDPQLLAKTANFLENVLHSGAATCLICIGSVRRADAIWSCKHCYCFFHLNCIRRWANDSVAQIKKQVAQQGEDQGYYNHLGEYVPPKRTRRLCWCCPQCRNDYEPSERPSEYFCFCGKEKNPAAQGWLVPHSCGEMCNKSLQPECGHKCMLLCHPGPCPPCAQYASVKCLCGKAEARTVRCVDKVWQCKKKCTKLLPCGIHLCNQICHKPGECPPCSSTSVQPCECGQERKKRSCSDLKWQCQKICGKKYDCGIHNCRKVCHAGECGDCALGLPRSCPCGKTKKVGPCSESIEPCGDTCQKLLPCGLHTCAQRCHRGECNLCLFIVKKKCRCGLHEKELPCSKELTCDTKCKRIRDCGKHACSKKCCDGNCPPCDRICGKPLSCTKHRCQSICHEGPCYPCERQSQINCSCGKTSKLVPCGREKSAKIVCLETCRIPPKCHHSPQHRCHKNECPPCNQKCMLQNTTTGCEHMCEAKCHAAVKVGKPMVNNIPWDKNKMFEYKCLPHPQCEQIVTVTCIGGHETAEWPCWNSKPTSCQRPCQRLLRCGNHKCAAICHAVADIQNMNAQDGCLSCEEGCKISRPPGCIHPCMRACHTPPCFACQVVIKTKCHCGLSMVAYKCSEYFDTEGGEEQKLARQQRFKCCGNRCVKNYPCGHRCTAICHPGPCPDPTSCRKKVRIFCACKRLKLEISCDKQRAGMESLPCDENCVQTRAQMAAIELQKAELLRQEEEKRNRLELEQFEKKFGKRKPKERKETTVHTVKKPINWQMVALYCGIAIAVLGALAVAYLVE